MYIRPDVVVPGLLPAGDLPDVAAALAPRPLRLRGLVDALNRRRDDKTVRLLYRPALDAYRRAMVAERIATDQKTSSVAACLPDAPGKPGR